MQHETFLFNDLSVFNKDLETSRLDFEFSNFDLNEFVPL